MGLLRFLGLAPDAGPSVSSDSDAVRKVAEALERLDPERARFVAGFAFVLGRVARADLDVSSIEVRAMERIIQERMGLPEDQAVLVVQIAKTQARLLGSTENFIATREFERMATREQKLLLLECLFAVAAADEHIETAEDNEIRNISRELKLEHGEFIAARTRFREHLGVLKSGPDAQT